MAATKDVVYIDIDEDITSVINKVEGCKDKVVALVLPKRATVFQSTINMKLLKKSAAAMNKSLVLITSDTSIYPLAGAARLHVAKSLQTKPTIPDNPHLVAENGIVTSEELADTTTPAAVPSEASAGAAVLTDEVIELDNTEKASKSEKHREATDAPQRKNRKLVVPNFDRFRVKVFLSMFLILLLIVGGIFGFIILPKAKITIKTDATTTPVSVLFTATTAVTALDKEKNLVPAKLAESKKTDTEKVPATGKQDQGTKATGTVSLYNCNRDDKLSDTDHLVPSGTSISDTSGHTFITQEDVNVQPSGFKLDGVTCKSDKPSNPVDVTAQNAGGDYNLSARSYTVSGFSTITAVDSSGMGGGTSKIVTVVSADDITGAQAKLTGRQKSAAVGELDAALNVSGGFALDQTLDEGAPVFTQSVATNQPASDVTVTAVTDYKMLGIANSDLKVLVEAAISKSITNSKEKILSNGLENKTLIVTSKKSATEQALSLSTTATVGPDIDTAEIARESAGKKRGDIISSLTSRDDIKDVTVTYSPFWVMQTPKKASKITVVVNQANGTQ